MKGGKDEMHGFLNTNSVQAPQLRLSVAFDGE